MSPADPHTEKHAIRGLRGVASTMCSTEALADLFTSAKGSNASHGSQIRWDDPDLMFGRVLLAGLKFDAPDQLVSRVL